MGVQLRASMSNEIDLESLRTAELKEAFDEFDKDGSGSISSAELLHVMRALGENPTEDDVLNLMLEADLDGSGTIEFPEFLELMKQKFGEMDIEDDMRDAFNMFDRDKDGFVDIKELIKVASTMGFSLDIEDLRICLNEVDEDGDGKLNYQEFSKMLLNN